MSAQGVCKVAVVSSYPPKNCGLATFTAALLLRLRTNPNLPARCEFGVIAVSDPSDRLLYSDPIVHYDLRIDSVSCLKADRSKIAGNHIAIHFTI